MNKITRVRTKTETAIMALQAIQNLNAETGRDNTRVYIPNATWRIFHGGDQPVGPRELFDIGQEMLSFGWGLMVTGRGAVAVKVETGENSKRLTSSRVKRELKFLTQLAAHACTTGFKLVLLDEDDEPVLGEQGYEISFGAPEEYIRFLAENLRPTPEDEDSED